MTRRFARADKSSKKSMDHLASFTYRGQNKSGSGGVGDSDYRLSRSHLWRLS